MISARRAGTTATWDQLNKYFGLMQMPIITSRYWNIVHGAAPEQVKQELQIMCVMFTEEVGGTLIVEYDEDGYLQLITQADEGDLLYDEIGSGLKIHQIQLEKRELLEALEMYYKVFVLGETE